VANLNQTKQRRVIDQDPIQSKWSQFIKRAIGINDGICRVSFNLPHVERAPPVAITNKTPAYEYYGFVMYLASFVAFGR